MAEKNTTLEDRIRLIGSRFDELNTLFIEEIAAQIRAFGELSRDNIRRMVTMTIMNRTMAMLNVEMGRTVMQAVSDLGPVYRQTVDNVLASPRFKRALAENPLPAADSVALSRYAEAVSRQTAGTIYNLSNTTVMSEDYRHAIDMAILSASSGAVDYRVAMRQVVQDLGRNGLRVQYESGLHRRLDTAVRQNITNGVRQVYQHCADIVGEKLGYDAIELTAHLNSAPDHEPVQGRVFMNDEFAKMQAGSASRDIDGTVHAGFRRSIGEWNCRHMALPFSTEYNTRTYTPERLQEMADQNAEGFTLGGKHYSMYQGTQKMRELETEIRRQKDTSIAASAAGDKDLQRASQLRINSLVGQYRALSEASGLSRNYRRIYVPGFKSIRV